MPRQKSGDGGPTVSHQRILDEAIRLFGERGYPVIGMRDLSDAVGILPGSLYSHIQSKEHLLLDIVVSGITAFIDAIEPIVDSDLAPDVKLREAIRAHMRVLAEQVEQTRVTFHQWQYLGPEKRPEAAQVRADYEALLTRILDEGIKTKAFRRTKHQRLAILSIIGILGSATEWYQPEGRSSSDEIADAITDNLLLGLQQDAS